MDYHKCIKMLDLYALLLKINYCFHSVYALKLCIPYYKIIPLKNRHSMPPNVILCHIQTFTCNQEKHTGIYYHLLKSEPSPQHFTPWKYL